MCGQFEIVSSVEELHDYVDKDSLPTSLGGTVNSCQSDWLSYQRVHLMSYRSLVDFRLYTNNFIIFIAAINSSTVIQFS